MGSRDHDQSWEAARGFLAGDSNDVNLMGNPVLDNLVITLVALGSEVWALRRRMLATEAVMSRHGIKPEMIETYMPSEQEEVTWRAERDEFVRRTFDALSREGGLDIATPYKSSELVSPRREAQK